MQEKTDLTLNVEDYKLNIRVAGILEHKDYILLHKCKNKDYYALIGGRIKIGETSEEAIKREILEETGKEVEIVKYIATIENFFKEESQKYHEINFIYQLKFKEENENIEKIENKEGKKYIEYKWISKKEIENIKILPQPLKEIINNNLYPIHKINKEI